MSTPVISGLNILRIPLAQAQRDLLRPARQALADCTSDTGPGMLLAQVWETEIHVAVLDHALASGLLTLLGISQVARCDNGIEAQA